MSKRSLREIYEESRYESDDDDTARDVDVHGFRIMGVVVMLIMGWIIYSSVPVIHAGEPVQYNTAQMAQAAFTTEEAGDAALSLSMDFSRILTPAAMESTEIMRHVASACLPEEIPTLVMPGGAVINAFDKATDYLACSMRTQPQRFCNLSERQRLIEQLMQYRDRRQNLLAVVATREALLRTRAAQQQMIGMKATVEESGESIASQRKPKADTISPRILRGVTYLVENGLLARSDFGFFGLYLPEEYLPALMTERTVASCGF